jgi:hypothetical protein
MDGHIQVPQTLVFLNASHPGSNIHNANVTISDAGGGVAADEQWDRQAARASALRMCSTARGSRLPLTQQRFPLLASVAHI